MLTRHSIGALATLNTFLTANSRRLSVRSASKPTAKVSVASDKPMMVRNCRCQPYASLLSNVCCQPCCLKRCCAIVEGVGVRLIRVTGEVAEGVCERGKAEYLLDVSAHRWKHTCFGKAYMKEGGRVSRG